jgi:hypothetical protein
MSCLWRFLGRLYNLLPRASATGETRTGNSDFGSIRCSKVRLNQARHLPSSTKRTMRATWRLATKFCSWGDLSANCNARIRHASRLPHVDWRKSHLKTSTLLNKAFERISVRAFDPGVLSLKFVAELCRAFSPRSWWRLSPGASPQAVMGRAFGPKTSATDFGLITRLNGEKIESEEKRLPLADLAAAYWRIDRFRVVLRMVRSAALSPCMRGVPKCTKRVQGDSFVEGRCN